MKLLQQLDRRFGRYAVPNVTLWIVLAQAFFYLAETAPRGGQLIDRIELVPALVLEGEVWRLLTYPLTPPQGSLLFTFIYFWAFYYFGSAVESIWGAFRYNLYLILGFALTAAAAFAEPDWPASNHYVEASVFLAYATLIPDATIYFNLLLPIKAKYVAALTWALYTYWAWFGTLAVRLMIFAAVTNFFLFFGTSAFNAFRHARRKRNFQKRVAKSQKTVRHECRTCGLTSDMAPKTTFRYCSQCTGQCCYCPEHLKDHEHVVAEK